jgi:nucleoside phosphorylase
MKILLLEDSQEKAHSIIATIKKLPFINDADIDISSDLKYAKDQLKKIKYDLFLVDIQVPKRFGEKAKNDAGFNFIYQLSEKSQIYKIPNHIIAITEYVELFQTYKEQLNTDMVTVIQYDETGEEWKFNLTKNISSIESTLQSTHQSSEYKYDLGIICALNDPEFKQIELLSNKWEAVNINNSTLPFKKTTFKFANKKLNVIAISINKMGMVPTAVLSTQMIENFRPKYLVMTGIAAGIKGDVKLGDILVANPTWDSGSGKFKEAQTGEKVFEIDPKQEPLDHDIENYIVELSKDKGLMNQIREEWTAKEIPNVLNVHIGPIASGAAVIADKDIADKIQKQQSRKLIGIEMEGYGIYYAATHATHPRPLPLVIKSVCDFADKEKNDGYQNYAAYTSAKFLYELAKRYI